MMTADLSGVVQGQILEDLWTNRSMYNPGESIQATAKLSGNASGAYRAEIYLNHLGETVWQTQMEANGAAGSFVFSLTAPGEDFKG